MSQSSNPLQQYFRQPAIYLNLPSEGKFWPEKAIELPQTQEVPVLPMTAVDEITYRTPDALFNGQAVVSVVQSCIPAIKDAWVAPAIDINSMLVAIRIASYGHELELGTECPHCKHEADYGIDLRVVLDGLKLPDYSQPLVFGDLEILLQPISYKHQNEVNLAQFGEQRTLQMIPESDLPEDEKFKLLNEALKKITELTVDAMKWSIASISTPQAVVTNPDHISEFLKNCDRKMFVVIRDKIISLRADAEMKPVTIKCTECGGEFEKSITLDQTSFFGDAS